MKLRIKSPNRKIEKLKEEEKHIEAYGEGCKLCESHMKRILKN
jgi:hypothetical protein